ncbi:Xaa-Pro dipeptidase [Inhella inkyongensis]|uniref:Xaa-Pro dipeptidase n=1 Tax=Inhella inkyongensis TaxID=392593 RepID=A0A840S222_9BURK|nr:Xaa-Pro dipeptidase [Inhella inkyongensis]MBB5203136.1 Xaa-Pro dipeptidase [Inhella inkyongensis]
MHLPIHSDLGALFAAHIQALQQRCEGLMAAQGYDALAIAAGVEKFAFLDDRPYSFQPNPHFVHWAPLTQHPGSWVLVRPAAKPLLIYLQAEDYWHAVPAAPAGYWVDAFEIVVVRTPEQAAQQLRDAAAHRPAWIAEADALPPGFSGAHNPEPLLAALHFARGVKTEYELQLMRAASRRAALGHLAARAAFEAGGSEADIHGAYLAASGQAERELPYGNIVALSAHAAVLHWQFQDREPPAQPSTLLIDAGAQCAGYASDITRTWLHPQAAAGRAREDFETLLTGMEALELALVDQVRAGSDYVAIHLDAHRRIAALLIEQGLLKGLSAEAAVAQGATRAFFPHGVGHLLGIQVHDIAGLQIDAQGGRRERPAGHPYLRLTRHLEPGMVVTIEPGLYFIPMLLRELQAGPLAAHVDWARVEALKPFGGIRIEDDVVCRAGGAPENLSREAFAALGA